MTETPVGSSFEHNGTTYEIEPTVYCAKTVRVLKRAMMAKRLKQIDEMITYLQAQQNSKLGPALAMLYDLASKPYTPNAIEIARAIQDDEDIIAAVLLHCSPQVANESEARKLVDEYPDLVELGMIATEASGVYQVGNSLRARAIRDRITHAQRNEENGNTETPSAKIDHEKQRTIAQYSGQQADES